MGFNGKVAHYTPRSSDPETLPLKPANMSDVATNAKRSGWLFLGSSGGQPPVLYYSASLKDEPRVVKTPSLTPEHIVSIAPKKIEWKSDGFTIEGRLYLPPQAATQHVPLIVEVHGGPLGAYSDAHEPWVDFLLGHGWAVFRTNPRGSSGYGAAFAAANKNDLGGGDYRDIMAGVDYVLKTESIDGDRMALMGYSYGGEMAGFVEGKTTRFKAIISGAPVIDQYSEYGTESGSWYDRWYFGKPWEHPVDAWRQSPLAAAGKAKTPFLLLQGQSDTTDPLGQSQEMYRALRQMGAPVELVTYPRDNHGPLAFALYGYPVPEPWHGYDARRRVIDFIDKAFGTTPAK
jgi:dipeptidyl aminopeptidase/acylaminoacyl peptidase